MRAQVNRYNVQVLEYNAQVLLDQVIIEEVVIDGRDMTHGKVHALFAVIQSQNLYCGVAPCSHVIVMPQTDFDFLQALQVIVILGSSALMFGVMRVPVNSA